MDVRAQLIGLLEYTERMATLGERAVFRLADYRALVIHEQELRNRVGIHHDLAEGDRVVVMYNDDPRNPRTLVLTHQQNDDPEMGVIFVGRPLGKALIGLAEERGGGPACRRWHA